MCVHVVSSAAIAPTNVASQGDSTEATHTFCRIFSANYLDDWFQWQSC